MAKEDCGVVGVFSLDGSNVIPMVIDSLRALQHRGQEAWGLAIPKKDPMKKIGLVSASASEFKKISEEYASPAAIGHVRYSRNANPPPRAHRDPGREGRGHDAALPAVQRRLLSNLVGG